PEVVEAEVVDGDLDGGPRRSVGGHRTTEGPTGTGRGADARGATHAHRGHGTWSRAGAAAGRDRQAARHISARLAHAPAFGLAHATAFGLLLSKRGLRGPEPPVY